ncbi:MAG: hypothetical protein FJ116_08735 [Deltaproteobacteria bacterium]|nr:hypothetical protein [Deltaproteobacteria bacterium]
MKQLFPAQWILLFFFMASTFARNNQNTIGGNPEENGTIFLGTHAQEQRRLGGDLNNEKTQHGCERLYHSNPEHLWNRLYTALFIRRTKDGILWGCDVSDPLFWRESDYLFTGERYRTVLALLDDFNQSHGERLVTDLLKRALFQRDLLQVFSAITHAPTFGGQQNHARERAAIQQRLAVTIRRLGLNQEQIRQLPSNFDEAVRSKKFSPHFDPKNPGWPFLPGDLFDPKGPWTLLSSTNRETLATNHLGDFNGRSNFQIYVNFPGGKEKLNKFLKMVNAASIDSLPRLPNGTQFVIVRRAVLVNSNGEMYSSPFIESVRSIVHTDTAAEPEVGQVFGDFTFSRKRLLAGQQGGLRPVRPHEMGFPFLVLQSPGIDHLEPHEDNPEGFGSHGERPILSSCIGCHSGNGPVNATSFNLRRSEGRTIETSDTGSEQSLEGLQSLYRWGVLRALMEFAGK